MAVTLGHSPPSPLTRKAQPGEHAPTGLAPISIWSGRMTKFVFDGATDPRGQGSVVGLGASTDLVEEFWWEADRDDRRQTRLPALRWSLRLLVVRLGVVLVFLLGCQRLLAQRSLRYWIASPWVAT